MIIKTSESSFGQLREIVEKNHSYDVPEVLSLDISQLHRTGSISGKVQDPSRISGCGAYMRTA